MTDRIKVRKFVIEDILWAKRVQQRQHFKEMCSLMTVSKQEMSSIAIER